MTIAGPLRVIDFGTVAPLHSQTLWHAIVYGVSSGAAPTLSFVRPSSPYVSIGYHRRLDEVDTASCGAKGWPVYRRMIGGGPVYLDHGQLFFQITMPISSLPAGRQQALRMLLSPAVDAFRELGIEAELDDHLEIVVGDRKICGYGAGQIGDAAIVVGNLILDFDHEAAASILRTPSAAAHDELSGLIHRYVAATPTDPEAFKKAAVAAYSRALSLHPRDGQLGAQEKDHLEDLDQRFCSQSWLAGQSRPRPAVWQAKVRGGVWMFAAHDQFGEVVVSVERGKILKAHLQHSSLNGSRSSLEASLAGLTLAEAACALGDAGTPGRDLAKLMAAAEPGRSA